MKILHTDARILIATFSPWNHGVRFPINGNLEPMRDFFVPRARETVIIDQVYPGSDFVLPRIEVYQIGKKLKVYRSSFVVALLASLLWLFNRGGTHIVFKLRDFLSVIDWGLRDRKRYDLFIGFEAVNALAGVLLRRVGRVKRVVYYVSDYSPNRYAVRWFNALYLWLDRLAATYADFIWDVSPAMQPARITAGLDSKKSAPVVIVPNALYPGQIRQLPARNIEPYSLVFLGTLGEENGPGLAIEAASRLVKEFPKVHLHIVGGPSSEIPRLKKLVRELKLESNVVFHGFISSRTKAAVLLRRFAIALAPYRAVFGSVRWYGDATKIRAYMAAGLPTITTHVPPLGKDIEESGAGVVVSDTPEAIAAAALKLFRDRRQFVFMRKRAIAFAKHNTWEHEYVKALSAMEKLT